MEQVRSPDSRVVTGDWGAVFDAASRLACSDRSTLQVIRTMACDYALCSLFVPGDRQVILGTKVRINTNHHVLLSTVWNNTRAASCKTHQISIFQTVFEHITCDRILFN